MICVLRIPQRPGSLVCTPNTPFWQPLYLHNFSSWHRPDPPHRRLDLYQRPRLSLSLSSSLTEGANARRRLQLASVLDLRSIRDNNLPTS